MASTMTVPRLGSYLRRLQRGSAEAAEWAQSRQHVASDEYIRWLCTVLGGWLGPDHGNLQAFDYAVRYLPAEGAIVEIGSFLGLSTNIIAYLTLKYRRENLCFTCDPWVFEGTDEPIGGYFDAGCEAFRRYAKEVFRMSTALFSAARKPYALEIFSAQFFEHWHARATVEDLFGRQVTLGGPISFAYIDGAHTAEAVQDDFLGVDRHLLLGGFILFDDSDDGGCFPEVTRVVRAVAEDPSYELVAKTPHYFVRKKG